MWEHVFLSASSLSESQGSVLALVVSCLGRRRHANIQNIGTDTTVKHHLALTGPCGGGGGGVLGGVA